MAVMTLFNDLFGRLENQWNDKNAPNPEVENRNERNDIGSCRRHLF